jgi:hypothetical protein
VVFSLRDLADEARSAGTLLALDAVWRQVSARGDRRPRLIDDHSRAVMAARFGFAEDTIRLAAALRPALASRGIPSHAYVDYADPPVMPAGSLEPVHRLGFQARMPA